MDVSIFVEPLSQKWSEIIISKYFLNISLV